MVCFQHRSLTELGISMKLQFGFRAEGLTMQLVQDQFSQLRISRHDIRCLFIRKPITLQPHVLPSPSHTSFIYTSSLMCRVIYGFNCVVDSFRMWKFGVKIKFCELLNNVIPSTPDRLRFCFSQCLSYLTHMRYYQNRKGHSSKLRQPHKAILSHYIPRKNWSRLTSET